MLKPLYSPQTTMEDTSPNVRYQVEHACYLGVSFGFWKIIWKSGFLS